ncbi:MAG: hypothetical protein WC876_11390 [Candidatus Thermoplasmatota archaeon]|jgi:hypothetical protein
MMRLPAALALVLSTAMAGCGAPEAPLPPEWRGRDLEQPGWTTSTLEPEWTLVLEYPLSSGSQLDWNWFTQVEQRQLYFQVVRIEDGEPVKIVARHASEEASQLTAPKAGVYQVFWMNDAFFATNFTWQAREGYSQRLYPPNEGPGCLMMRSEACLVPDLPGPTGTVEPRP